MDAPGLPSGLRFSLRRSGADSSDLRSHRVLRYRLNAEIAPRPVAQATARTGLRTALAISLEHLQGLSCAQILRLQPEQVEEHLFRLFLIIAQEVKARKVQ